MDRSRRTINSAAAILLMSLLALISGCGGETIETIKPVRKPIRESFSEPAKTRLEPTHTICAPVSGTIERIALQPGDPVDAGALIAQYDLAPFNEQVLTARALKAEIEAGIIEIRAAVKELETQKASAEDNAMDAIRLKQAQSRIESLVKLFDASGQRLQAMQKRFEHFDTAAKRVEKLVEDESAPRQQLDDLIIERDTADLARLETEYSTASLDADISTAKLEPALIEQTIADKRYLIKTLALKIEQADARLKQYDARLEQAAARLILAEHTLSLARIESPVRGVVLQRLSDGASPVIAGAPLLVVGNLDDMDIIAEVLTTDALKLKPGTLVELSPASGMEPFAGAVVRIEPAGFTKLSSLGVEQQRVNVLIKPQSRPANLGIGYRVQATFITAEKPDALTVPRYSALQDRDFKFYVLIATEDNPPVKTPVEIGLRGRLDLEILSGVGENDAIVRTPTAAQMGE